MYVRLLLHRCPATIVTLTYLGGEVVHKVCRIGRPNAISEDQKEHKTSNGGLNDGEEQDDCKNSEKVYHAQKHNRRTHESCEASSQNGRPQMQQSIFGASVAIRITRDISVRMTKVDHKVTAQPNEDCKANTFPAKTQVDN